MGLSRYLLHESVLDQSAFENARRDHQAIAGKREALAVLPRAWAELVAEGHELLIETLVDKAEALSGYAPSGAYALTYLQTLPPWDRALSHLPRDALQIAKRCIGAWALRPSIKHWGSHD